MQLPFINDDYYDGVGGDHHYQGKEPGHGEDEHEVEELLDKTFTLTEYYGSVRDRSHERGHLLTPIP